MALNGADVAQLRAAAAQFTRGASTLESSVKVLHSLISGGALWRGPDADRFRSEWTNVSARSITAAADSLRRAADDLRRNADQQDQASVAGGGASADLMCRAQAPQDAPTGLNGLWNEVKQIPTHSSGYRVQEVIGTDGVTRYIVYITGTDSADGQTGWSNIPAAEGIPDSKQLAELKQMIPKGSEVMLVGYSQGGMDAQNIAMQHDNGFQVTQVVTYGSPVREDLTVPAIHLQADGDGVPESASIIPWSPYLLNSTGVNPEAHIYHGQSDVTGTSLAIHMQAYGELSQKWDQAQFGQAGDLTKFQGDAVSTVDLGVDGAPI
jgi:hypothetical protein